MELFFFYLIINLVVSFFIGNWSKSKGKGFGFGFLISLILSPLIGLIIVAIVKEDKSVVESLAIETGDYKKCPFCGETIKSIAIKCRYCSSDLPVTTQTKTARNADEAIVVCPSCKQTEVESKARLKTIIATKGFTVSYGSFLGIYRFECRKCGEAFKIESQLL